MGEWLGDAGPVLVTGAKGFIGRHLVNSLLADGVSVQAHDLPGLPRPAGWGDQVVWHEGDITDRKSLDRAMAECRVIFHLAAMVGDWGQESQHQRVTVEGSRILFQLAEARRIKVVLASSIVVYGDRLAQGVCTEETPFGQAQGPYSRAKQAQERLAWSHAERGMPLVVVRPANVTGAGSEPWVHAVLREMRRGTPCLIGGGRGNAGLIDVRNLVDVLRAAADAACASGQIFNACDGLSVSWRQYFLDLARIAAAPRPRSIPRGLAGALARVADRIWERLPLEGRPPITREALNLVGSDLQILATRSRELLKGPPRFTYSDTLQAIEAALREQR